MTKRTSPRSTFAAVGLLAAALLIGPLGAQASADANAFSGRATVVSATISGLPPIILSDTGPLPSSGGANQASLLSANVPGVLTANVLHATTVGQGNASRSEASAADLSLTVDGHTVTAAFLMARAEARCQGGKASVSGSSDIASLVIDGRPIVVSGAPNQTVTLANGRVIINEQSGSVNGNSGDVTVNALHVIVDPGLADVVISSAHADIACKGGCQSRNDFVTGGGWITGTPSGARGTFGVAGGIKNGFWGHLVYIDHGPGGPKVKGTGVTAYSVTGNTSRHIEGTAELNGTAGYTYEVDVADNGEPGSTDTFSLRVTGPTSYSASGTLGGGNIQLHMPKCP